MLLTITATLLLVNAAAALLDSAGAQMTLSHEEAESGGGGLLTRDFRRKVNHWLGKWHVPGLAVGVVDGDGTWTQVFHLFLFVMEWIRGNWW